MEGTGDILRNIRSSPALLRAWLHHVSSDCIFVGPIGCNEHASTRACNHLQAPGRLSCELGQLLCRFRAACFAGLRHQEGQGLERQERGRGDDGPNPPWPQYCSRVRHVT